MGIFYGLIEQCQRSLVALLGSLLIRGAGGEGEGEEEMGNEECGVAKKLAGRWSGQGGD